jgi:hypothetical protein
VVAEEGVTRFEVNRETTLLTDWSKSGFGFLLAQKYCKWAKITPICCKGEWRVCKIGSRFNNKAETNYFPVEGEALAVTNGLKKTRCEKFTVEEEGGKKVVKENVFGAFWESARQMRICNADSHHAVSGPMRACSMCMRISTTASMTI